MCIAAVALGAAVGPSGPAQADELGTPVQLASPAANVMLSADGSYLVYANHGLYGRARGGGDPTLLSAATPDRRLDLSADGSIIGFVTAAGDAHVVNRTRGTDELIATGIGTLDRLYVAQLATTVWYSKSGSLFSHDTATPAGAPNTDAALPTAAATSVFLVDGQGSRVLYSTNGVSATRQYTVASGVDELLFTNQPLQRDGSALSPSGRYYADGTVLWDLQSMSILTFGERDGQPDAIVSVTKPRFSLDEKWIVYAGGFRPGAWVMPVERYAYPHRVSRLDDFAVLPMAPVTVDPDGTNVAYSSLLDISGSTYAAYMAPVAFDTTPPQVTILNHDGDRTGPNNPVQVHATDGGSGIDHVSLYRAGSNVPIETYKWSPPSDPRCASDAAGIRDDRDCTVSFPLNLNGDLTLTAVAVDVEGNSSTSQTVHVFNDATPPTVTGTPDRPANSRGWYRAPVTVSWTASDPDDTITNPAPTTVSSDGRGQVVRSAPACDLAANCASGTYTLDIDQVGPTVVASPDHAPGPSGWYRSPVTVNFSCADALSGISSCPASVRVSTDGRDQIVRGTGVDAADNTADAQTSVSVDMTSPSATVTSGPLILAALNQRFTGTAADATSGVARVDVVMWNSTSSATLSSADNSLTLSCDAARSNCSWSARPPLRGNVSYTVYVYDVAGNYFAVAPGNTTVL